METGETTDKSLKITRRQLLRTAAAALAGGSVGLAASSLLIGQTDSQPQKLPSRRVREGREEVAEQKPEIKSLTFERAKELVPSIANLFISSTNSQQKSQDIVDHTFIVRESKSWKEILNIPDESIHELPAIQNLGRDYPELVLDRDLARDLAGMHPLAAFVTDERGEMDIFVNLIMFTEHNSSHFKGGFDQIGGKVACESVDPIIAFQSILLHELTHREGGKTSPILETEGINAHINFGTDEVTPIEKSGFVILGEGRDKKLVRIPGFEEIVADYIAARILTQNGLRYAPQYTRPIDLYNFGQILDQAKISNNELLELHRKSKLRGLLLKIGRAAKGELKDEEAIKLGLSLSLKMPGNNIWPIPWNEIKQLFPSVDTTSYKYSDLDFAPPPADNGCMVK